MKPLLNDILEAHGGYERWKQVKAIHAQLKMGGNILLFKCKNPKPKSLQVTIEPHRIFARLHPFPKPGHTGIYKGEHVYIEDEHGQIISERKKAKSHAHNSRFWDDLDVLYFFGYALWNYILTPYLFTQPGFELEELPIWKENGLEWRCIKVRFPEDIPTHCREQRFYFGPDHLLGRLDYTAECFSKKASGVHYCRDYKYFQGFPVPTHRFVLPTKASGLPRAFPKAMEGWIEHVEMEFEGNAQ